MSRKRRSGYFEPRTNYALNDDPDCWKLHLEVVVSQTSISNKATEPDACPSKRRLELEEQIFRLQFLVSYLIEKNEQLRQRLARCPREARATASIKTVGRPSECNDFFPINDQPLLTGQNTHPALFRHNSADYSPKTP